MRRLTRLATAGGAVTFLLSSWSSLALAAPADGAPAHHDARTLADALAVVGVAAEGGSRHFSYVDRVTPTLRPYDLFVAPLLAIHGEVYPLVNAGMPALAGLGATGRYARAIALASQDTAGNPVGTSWQEIDIGLRERIRLGAAFILGIDAAYGQNDFSFDKPATNNAELPGVGYKTVRAGLDGRAARGDLAVYAMASYLGVLSTGDFGAMFPHTSVGGVEAEVGVSNAMGASFELSLDLRYTRFFYDLRPVPRDAHVAGGALDQMATVSLGLAYFF